MGREIRRVPPDWQHPLRKRPSPTRGDSRLADYQPLYDQDYESACQDWLANLDAWRRGERQGAPETCLFYWDWDGHPPDPIYYRERKWTPEEATCFQVYETVSEGTPVTPVFRTKADLVEYLVIAGDYWRQEDARKGRICRPGWDRAAAEQFVNEERTPSFIARLTETTREIQSPGDPVITKGV